MEEFWGVPKGRIQAKPGLTSVEMFQAFGKSEIKAMWVACTNPGQSLPNVDAYRKGMRRDDVEGLRLAGLSDAEIFEVALVTAYYNYTNRIAEGLGVEPE